MKCLGNGPKTSRLAALIALSTSMAMPISCTEPPANTNIEAGYDADTGQLDRLTINSSADGKPNITSLMQGTKFVKIEIDSNEDGKTDRWEYYGDGEKLSRVGLSRANDGTEDSWAIPSPDGSIARIEVSTRRNGKANRTEFYEKGVLARAEEDSNLDGRIDKWEQYESGVLVSASFDTTNSGQPTTTVDYRKP
jgi:hypothetical protein